MQVGEDKNKNPLYYKNYSDDINDKINISMNHITDLFGEYEDIFPYQSEK